MKCEKSGSHMISYQSLLLSTIVLNDANKVLNSNSLPKGIHKTIILCFIKVSIQLDYINAS